jgi:transcriptional regulator with XRE-family HTH domain
MAKKSTSHAGNRSLVVLGETLRRVRKEQGLSQEDLANNSGLDRSYLGGIERGEHNISFINLIKLADYLGIKPSELLGKSDL